jgi:hypothetical protein
MMLEELERRNYAQATTRLYLQTIKDFARYFKRPLGASLGRWQLTKGYWQLVFPFREFWRVAHICLLLAKWERPNHCRWLPVTLICD